MRRTKKRTRESEHLAFYEMGIRFQQAILCHEEVMQEHSCPSHKVVIQVLANAFGKLPNQLQERLNDQIDEIYSTGTMDGVHPGLERVPKKGLVSWLHPMLKRAREAVGRYASSQSRVEHAADWFHLGVFIADGEMRRGEWAWKHKPELDRLLTRLGVSLESVFDRNVDVEAYQMGHDITYPRQYVGWYGIEAALARLRQPDIEPVAASANPQPVAPAKPSHVEAHDPNGNRPEETGSTADNKAHADGRTSAEVTPPTPSGNLEVTGQSDLPEWDKRRRTLTFRGKAIRKFSKAARNQTLVLAAFQELKWQERIDDPIRPDMKIDSKSRVQNTVKDLNKGINGPIRFSADGSGQGFCWKIVE